VRRYTIEVAGARHVIDVDEITGDRFRVFAQGRAFEVYLEGSEDVAESVITPEVVPLAPVAHHPAFQPPPPEALEDLVPASPPPQIIPPGPPRGAFRGELKAPMPGTITAIEITAGQEVKQGDVLLKLEAMKMVNAIRSPQDGRVAEVRVQAGAQVAHGAVLVTFERS
jgi:biotin carboxyl carrier protein